MKKYLCILSVTTLALLNLFCKPTTEKITPVISDTINVIRPTIILIRRGCEGACPAYTLTFDMKQPGKGHFQQTFPFRMDTSFSVDETSIQRLNYKLEQFGFWQLKDSSIKDRTYDSPTMIIKVRATTHEKQIIFNGYQPALDSLAAMIDSVGKVNYGLYLREQNPKVFK